MFVEVLLILLVALFLFYKWATLKYSTFDERGVHYEKPVPLFGNTLSVVLNKESFLKSIIQFYRRNCSHKVCGYFNFREPVYMINDPESIKKIGVKDFDYFPNHHPFFYTNNDPMLDSMVGMMKDQRWKDMRNTLTPVFTAAKMRAMFPLMNECFAECLLNLRKQIDNNIAEVELKEHFTRLSNDVTATTAFGLKVNSYTNRNNEFYTIGQSIAIFRGTQIIKFIFSNLAPRLMSMLGIQLFNREKTQYFKRIVVDTMKYRKANNIVRPDMIQLMLEAKKESGDKWNDDEIAAQCFGFFFAAFENNANLICLTCYELINNPDIQQRLYEECLEIKKELNGAPLSYDMVGKMKYMDMVVSESLRKWTLAIITDRVCSKDYDLTDGDGNLIFKFKRGDRIWFPAIGLQWDERYFERPEIFNPERFSSENKDKIVPFTYLPFGVGPRICIGNRYALMQAKGLLYHLLLEFKLERSPKTTKDLFNDTRSFQISPNSRFWMNIVARK